MIVDTVWLLSHLDDPKVRIVDIRGRVESKEPRYHAEPELYASEHIPGAVFVDWTKDIVDLEDPVPVNIAGIRKFSDLMETLGIDNDTFVVAYDDHNTMFAGRLVWALRYYGHSKAAILDGGFQNWKREGKPVSSEIPRFAKTVFHAEPHPELKRSADDVQFRSTDTLLIDARRPEVFAKGHIPGAVNLPHPTLTDSKTGKYLPLKELKESFRSAGLDPDRLPEKIISYCNGGASATVVLTALSLLGREDIPLYDGSWNEWGKDPKRPKEGSDS